jgi:ribosomal protein S27AE
LGRSGGFRVFKIRVSNENLEKIRKLFRDFVQGKTKTKNVAYYRKQWIKEWENVLKMRNKKRTLPNPPAALLPIRFILPSSEVRGATFAPAIIDLRKGELRIPSYGIREKLPQKLVEALTEENSLIPRPEFILQVTRRGLLRLIAHRYVPPTSITLPLRLICIDENSYNGEALAVWDVLPKVVLSHYEVLKPPNRGFLDRTVALFQSAAAGKAGALEEVKKLLREAGKDESRIAALTTMEKLAEIAANTRKKEKRLNKAFAEKLTALVRKLIREARARGWSVAIVVDPIHHESLRGSKLQRTLLKPRRLLKNLAYYEGALFVLLRASGKQCPICGEWGIEVAHRRYRCPRCGREWDRDKCATFWLAKKFLNNYFKEESADETYININGWLREHPHGLQ